MKPKTTETVQTRAFLLWGRSNVGKTTTAVTADPAIDASKIGVTRQVAENTILVGVENGVASLKDAQIEVPLWFDLTEKMTTADGKPSLPVFSRAQDEVFSYIHKNATKDTVVVYDSITAFDMFANGFHCEYNNTREYQVLNMMSKEHLNLSVALANLPGMLVAIAHGKFSAPIDNDKSRALKEIKAKVSSVSGQHLNTSLALTGQGGQHYWRTFNEIYFMDATPKRVAGKTTQVRVLNTQSTAVAESKTKHPSKLEPVEPADLGAILRKIEAAS